MATATLTAPPIISPARLSLRRASASKSATMMIGKGAAKYKGTKMRAKKLTDMIEAKVMEAKQVCEGDKRSSECKVAWDEVEEVSQAMADLRRKLAKHEDPLEFFCSENPNIDECVVDY
ncbi:calvin cycle protein CP12-3, chloroplastic [Heracleum sosnowskyi]|uniref:Calvin cycle protein CP12-3, chloroplastic n=1 Tax=Heracleum sosnowskyi TaxID=360622 RepID=A0AAD8M7T0_9APIA|nr:calvin cycle protein CP12-3, chloroplastic [Heracleum sosnowskyi]